MSFITARRCWSLFAVLTVMIVVAAHAHMVVVAVRTQPDCVASAVGSVAVPSADNGGQRAAGAPAPSANPTSRVVQAQSLPADKQHATDANKVVHRAARYAC